MQKQILMGCVLVLACVLLTACGEPNSYHTTDRNEYLQTEGHIENEGMDIESGLYIFPESIAEYKEAEYKYWCEEGLLDNAYMIFLKIAYPSEQAYKEEITRLQNIVCSIEVSGETVRKQIEYSETLFEYPAYIAIYNSNVAFEYALVDEAKQEIVYVWWRFYEDVDFLPREYRPLEYQDKKIDYDLKWKNPNIYYEFDGFAYNSGF